MGTKIILTYYESGRDMEFYMGKDKKTAADVSSCFN